VPEVPPGITLSLKDTVILRRGERFEITCRSANVNPDFSVTWDFPQAAVRLMEGWTPPQTLYVRGTDCQDVKLSVFLSDSLALFKGHESPQSKTERDLHCSQISIRAVEDTQVKLVGMWLF